MAEETYKGDISKHTAWDGDASTGDLPVCGASIEAYIKETFGKRAGVFHPDGGKVLVFADSEDRDEYLADRSKVDLLIGSFDAPAEYKMTVQLLSPSYEALLKGASPTPLQFTFDTVNSDDQSQGESVTVVYSVTMSNGVKNKVTQRLGAGATATFLPDKYLGDGVTQIVATVTGDTTLASTSVAVSYRVVDLSLSDTFDISQVYAPDGSVLIPYTVSGWGTKIMEWYLDGEQLEYVANDDQVLDVTSARRKSISLPGLSPGTHSIQFRAKTEIDGQPFYSRTLYREIMVSSEQLTVPVVAVALDIPPGMPIADFEHPLCLYGAEQYVAASIKLAAYNRFVATTPVEVSLGGTLISSFQLENGLENALVFTPMQSGDLVLSVSYGDYEREIGVNAAPTSTGLSENVANRRFNLSAQGKSNSSDDKDSWADGGVACSFDGFAWNQASGWDGTALVVGSGASLTVNAGRILDRATTDGATLEIELESFNVSNDDAPLLDMIGDNGAGIMMTASEIKLVSGQRVEASTKFKPGGTYRLSIVIYPKAGMVNSKLAMIYVNGIASAAANYSDTDSFGTPKPLTFLGTPQGQVKIRSLCFYDTALSAEQVLDNYILSRPTSEEMLEVFHSNNICRPGTTEIDPDALAGTIPMLFITGNVPELEGTNRDKNKTITVDAEFRDYANPERNWSMTSGRLRPQGTSSMGYPKKNFRIDTTPTACKMYDYNGNRVASKKWAMRENSIAVNLWCLKADYAESSSSHNTGIARIWNTAMYNALIDGEYLLRTNAQKAAIEAGYDKDVRTAIDGFPIVLFYRLDDNSPWIFAGKYNMNNDKSTEAVFGFRDIPGFNNSRVECWEVLDNGNPLALFTTVDNWATAWSDAYEARYPDKNKNTAALKRLADWLASTKNDPDKFEAEKYNYLDVPKCAAYYVYFTRFGAVDQLVKNAMITTEDGIHWYFINYDNDTVNGLVNNGRLILSPYVTRMSFEPGSDTAYAFAGHESVLWNNAEADADFMDWVRKVDAALAAAGLNIDNVLRQFNDMQTSKWCERVYNQDAQYKYVGPYVQGTDNNLFMLQGSRRSHRDWWLSSRFTFYDSLFMSPSFKASAIEFKLDNNTAPGLRFSVRSEVPLYCAYGKNDVVKSQGNYCDSEMPAVEYVTDDTLNVGDVMRLYGAPMLSEVDLADMQRVLNILVVSGARSESLGTRLKRLILSSDPTLKNRSLTVIQGLGTLSMLEELDIRGFLSLALGESLSTLSQLRIFRAKGSAIGAFSPAKGAPLEEVSLPETCTAIQLNGHPNLLPEGFTVDGIASCKTLQIEGCPGLQPIVRSLYDEWFAANSGRLSECTLRLDGLDWGAMPAERLVAMGAIGTLSLKGKITLASAIDEDMVQKLRSIYGDKCFDASSPLWICAEDAAYIPFSQESIVKGEYSQAAPFIVKPAVLSSLPIAMHTLEYSTEDDDIHCEVCDDAQTLLEHGVPIAKVWADDRRKPEGYIEAVTNKGCEYEGYAFTLPLPDGLTFDIEYAFETKIMVLDLIVKNQASIYQVYGLNRLHLYLSETKASIWYPRAYHNGNGTSNFNRYAEYIIRHDKNGFNCNGSNWTGNKGTDLTIGDNTFHFMQYNSNVVMYYMRVYHGEDLIYDLRPWITAFGTACMRDELTGELYGLGNLKDYGDLVRETSISFDYHAYQLGGIAMRVQRSLPVMRRTYPIVTEVDGVQDIPVGETSTFTATAYDQYDLEPTAPYSFHWSLSNASMEIVEQDNAVCRVRATSQSAASCILRCEAWDGFGEVMSFKELNLVVTAVNVIMTEHTNPEVMAVCYAQGLASNPSFMTLAEAEAVTNDQFGTVFQGSNIVHFEEIEYFTGVDTLKDHAFKNCKRLVSLTTPVTMTRVYTRAFDVCDSLAYLKLQAQELIGSGTNTNILKSASSPLFDIVISGDCVTLRNPDVLAFTFGNTLRFEGPTQPVFVNTVHAGGYYGFGKGTWGFFGQFQNSPKIVYVPQGWDVSLPDWQQGATLGLTYVEY